MAISFVLQHRFLDLATFLSIRATRMKVTALWRIDWTWHVPLQNFLFPPYSGIRDRRS
jgi:hypothetical protein